jgi:heptose I phosphotransferase
MKYSIDSSLVPFVSSFEAVMQLRGDVYRHVAGRETIAVELGDKIYFVKKHVGVGWREIIKNLCFLRLPIIGAMTEVAALEKLTALGVRVAECVGFGARGWNMARQQSFVITRAIDYQCNLEELTQQWRDTPPTIGSKRALIKAVASIARILHTQGVNHRDFYLCHFLKASEWFSVFNGFASCANSP